MVGAMIGRIADTGPKKEKLKLLKQFLDHPVQGEFFKRVIVYGMDPTIMFNVGKKSITSLVGKGSEALTDADLDVLDTFAKRTVGRTEAANWVNKRLESLNSDEGALLVKILDKDLDWGIGAGSVNSVVDGLITEFNVQLADKFNATKMAIPSIIEPKYDGMRVVARVTFSEADGPTVTFFTRSGKEVTSLPMSLMAEVRDVAQILNKDLGDASIILDGEVMGDDFKETMEKGRRKSEVFENAKFHVFDWLSGSEFVHVGKKPTATTLAFRAKVLAQALQGLKLEKIQRPKPYMITSEEEAWAYYENFRALGYEGAIVKNPLAGYVGKRTTAWMKLKAEETEDLPIVDFEPGEPGTKYANTLGKLVVDRKGIRVKASGMSDAERDDFWNNKERYRGQLVEIEFQEVTPDGSLRHPRYKRLRMDKSTW